MAEPIIPNPKPVIKPAVPEKNFDNIYIPKVEINAEPHKPWNCKIVTVPFDGDAETLREFFHVEIKDIKACAALAPMLATAMGAMLEALATMAIAAKATNTKVITPDNILEVLASLQGGQ